MTGLPRTPNDDLSVGEAMLGAASSASGEIRALYLSHARQAYQRAAARLEALRIRLAGAEAELLRAAKEASK